MAESAVQIFERPGLQNPVLIEGLPGIGFVANIGALHLITELGAKKFGEIRSPFFQDLAVTTEGGGLRFPINELYYYKSDDGFRDLIILYGNTQALTVYGQYELCGKILDIAVGFGCDFVVSMGGLKKDNVVGAPKVYCTATDFETLSDALGLGAVVIQGHVFGAAGLLIGLAKLRAMRGLCLLAETSGLYPDAAAARAVLEVLCKKLKLKVDLNRLEVATDKTHKILKSFGLIKTEDESEFFGLV